MSDLYFAVKSGDTLALARKFVAERKKTDENNRKLVSELNIEQYVENIMDGTVAGVIFNGKRHPDFCRPNSRAVCTPKKGSEWDKRLKAQVGYDRRGFKIAEALSVPTSIEYTTAFGSNWSNLGGGLGSGVGFLYLSEDGPFALYVPNIPAKVAKLKKQAEVLSVCDECENFKPEFDGARPILKEEWELTVAQFNLAEAQRRVAA